MLAFLSIPALISSIFFMSGGIITFASKRSVLPLAISAAVSAFYGVSSYLILAMPEKSIGFCLAATASLCALASGIFKLFFCPKTTGNEKAVGISVYSVGLGCTFFYTGVLFTKLALRPMLSI